MSNFDRLQIIMCIQNKMLHCSTRAFSDRVGSPGPGKCVFNKLSERVL
jgi:hypothetical protein